MLYVVLNFFDNIYILLFNYPFFYIFTKLYLGFYYILLLSLDSFKELLSFPNSLYLKMVEVDYIFSIIPFFYGEYEGWLALLFKD